MRSFVIRFWLFLTIGMLFSLGLHIFVLYTQEQPLFAHQLIKAYWVNYVLTLLIFLLLCKLRSKYNDQLGFVFMAGSLSKFLFFFILFYPGYYANQKMETIEFISFFIPYSVSLIIETTSVIKILNK